MSKPDFNMVKSAFRNVRGILDDPNLSEEHKYQEHRKLQQMVLNLAGEVAPHLVAVRDDLGNVIRLQMPEQGGR